MLIPGPFAQNPTCCAAAHRELAELAVDGVGIHHAGMLRSDRNLVERLFREGLIKARTSHVPKVELNPAMLRSKR